MFEEVFCKTDINLLKLTKITRIVNTRILYLYSINHEYNGTYLYVTS